MLYIVGEGLHNGLIAEPWWGIYGVKSSKDFDLFTSEGQINSSK